jgi:hypothetical protein
LRWEEADDGVNHQLFGPKPDSQDTWVFHSDSVHARKWNLELLRIPFGTPGCDNAIAIEFLRQKFKIVNPALSLRTLHVHKSEIRAYDPKDIVDRPMYMYIEPSGIHELKPILTWEGWADIEMKHKPLNRLLRATNPKMLPIFCSQLNRDSSFVWSATGENTYITPIGQDHIIELHDGAFVSPSGLVYKYTDVCVGNTDIQKNAWTDNRLSHLTPAHSVPSMMAFPLEASWIDNPALFTLYYLSRVIQQTHITPLTSFWCKKTAGLLPAIQLFKWNSNRGRLLEYDEQTQVFAESVYGRTAHGVRITHVEIENLRSNAVNWTSDISTDPPIIVLVTDPLHIKDALLKELELKARETHMVRIVPSAANASVWADALCGVSRIVLSTSAKHLTDQTWAWTWLAPKACKILELQEDREPSDLLVHLSAAAQQEWTLLQYPRSTSDGFRKILMKEFIKWVTVEKEDTVQLPILYTPQRSMKHGFFGHNGDSFRELIDLWAEKGYIERREDPRLTQCWLNKVGDILLYDRDNWSWLQNAPEEEQTYNLCLTGNADPSEQPKAQPWIFWPQYPRLVEEKSKSVRHQYDTRTDLLVFFSRIENEIQDQYGEDIIKWELICSRFSMKTSIHESQSFAHDEYLNALMNSKYGLCLRGRGSKCNREIELLAMGTVPVVTDGIDTKNYVEPLVDGVHILRVTSPKETLEKIQSITEAEWEVMSKAGYEWWKRNASVEGSWSRTKSYLTVEFLSSVLGGTT